MKKFIIYFGGFLSIIFCAYIIWAISGAKMHNFNNKCLMCHTDTPAKDAKRENMAFVNNIDKTCSICHTIDKEKSHPISVKPDKNIPLAAHLDANGLITCTTCHDVHKEDKTSNRFELSGMLWGHVKGRAFCSLCHNNELLDSAWRHQTAIPYAHSAGKLTETAGGGLLDKFSTECLSCHDGTISRFPEVEVRQGVWQHGIGMSHPVGVGYPRSEDFTDPESLPSGIQLFDGRIGCLSCHEIYGKEKHMLTMNNKGSRLCMACHKK